jgi:hypothetical protein
MTCAVCMVWVSSALAGEVRPSAVDLLRVTTAVPFPRGLAMVDGKLYVLCRGRVRGAGGVSAAVNDQAGTLYVVDPKIVEPAARPQTGEAVRRNGRVFAAPTDPPFRLWDRSAEPPEADRRTDRPYCTLRWHAPTHSFYICAFAGVDQPNQPGTVSFSKNLSDGLLRYDTRTQSWYELERHRLAAGGSYPHHDPRYHDPPHGWLNGPDNCLTAGHWLYAVAKDNSRLVRYDLSVFVENPDAGPPPGALVLGDRVHLRGLGVRTVYGHSMLAARDGWLYVGCRTSSVIFRIRLDAAGLPVEPIVGELVARFEPFDPRTLRSANITDMDFDDRGRLYVVSAQPARVFRFRPDPANVFDARDTEPWADLAAMTNNPRMKSENVLVHEGRLYVTSGDGYAYQQGASGTVYALPIDD